MKLAGKKALITRGNSRIGMATACLFISMGAEVAITGRDQQTLAESSPSWDRKRTAIAADRRE